MSKRYKTAKNPRVTARQLPLPLTLPKLKPTRKSWLKWAKKNIDTIDPFVYAWAKNLPDTSDALFSVTPRDLEDLSLLVKVSNAHEAGHARAQAEANAKADGTINRLITPRAWSFTGMSIEEAYNKLRDAANARLGDSFMPPPPEERNLHFPGEPIHAETNLWFDHEPMLYVVRIKDRDRPYLFAKKEEAEAFREQVLYDRDIGAVVHDVTTAWLFADADTAFTSFEADINYDG